MLNKFFRVIECDHQIPLRNGVVFERGTGVHFLLSVKSRGTEPFVHNFGRNTTVCHPVYWVLLTLQKQAPYFDLRGGRNGEYFFPSED